MLPSSHSPFTTKNTPFLPSHSTISFPLFPPTFSLPKRKGGPKERGFARTVASAKSIFPPFLCQKEKVGQKKGVWLDGQSLRNPSSSLFFTKKKREPKERSLARRVVSAKSVFPPFLCQKEKVGPKERGFTRTVVFETFPFAFHEKRGLQRSPLFLIQSVKSEQNNTIITAIPAPARRWQGR